MYNKLDSILESLPRWARFALIIGTVAFMSFVILVSSSYARPIPSFVKAKPIKADKQIKSFSLHRQILVSDQTGVHHQLQPSDPPPGASPSSNDRAFQIMETDSLNGTGLNIVSSVCVVSVSTGIQLDHPALTVDAFDGRDLIDANSLPFDRNGFGTYTAGLFASTNPDISPIRLTIGNGVVPIRSFDDSGGSVASAVNGIYAAIAVIRNHGGRGIIYAGFYTTTNFPELEAVFAEANSVPGILVVTPAGDDSKNILPYPAGYGFANIMSVSATDYNNRIANFSNYGSSSTIAAPGIDIYSTDKNSGYYTDYGTAPAASFVTAIATALMQQHPAWSAVQIKQRLMDTSTQVGIDVACHGIVNARQALGISAQSPNKPPVAVIGGPYVGIVGQPVVFNLSGSSDPEGSKLTYTLSDGDGHSMTVPQSTISAVYMNPGLYQAQLIVTDAQGLSSSPSSTTVTVSPSGSGGGGNHAPIITGPAFINGHDDEPIDFSVFTVNDPDGDNVRCDMMFGDGSVQNGLASFASQKHDYAPRLAHYFATLTATDSFGAQAKLVVELKVSDRITVVRAVYLESLHRVRVKARSSANDTDLELILDVSGVKTVMRQSTDQDGKRLYKVKYPVVPNPLGVTITSSLGDSITVQLVFEPGFSYKKAKHSFKKQRACEVQRSFQQRLLVRPVDL